MLLESGAAAARTRDRGCTLWLRCKQIQAAWAEENPKKVKKKKKKKSNSVPISTLWTLSSYSTRRVVEDCMQLTEHRETKARVTASKEERTTRMSLQPSLG